MRWTGLWFVVESALVAHAHSTRGGCIGHPISAQAFTCLLMSSGFELSWLPSSTGYVRGTAGDQTCQRSPTRHTVLDGETLVLLVEDGPPEHGPAVG